MEKEELEKYKIIVGDKEFTPSEYQIKIFEAIESNNQNLIISASAGSAKTSTIVNSLRYIDQNKKILFVAFNKSIAEKIQNDVKDNTNVTASTFHSLGFSILLENKIVSDECLNLHKYVSYIKSNIDSLTNFGETKTLGKNKSQYIRNIISLVDYCRYTCSMHPKQIKEIAEYYVITPIRDEFNVVRKVLEWGKDNVDEIDYTDMLWLPTILNLNTKKNKYDWIFIDEGQDTNVAEQKLIDKCFKRSTRFCIVGDEKQQINIWCGASSNAIKFFEKKPNTFTYSLPISYRCSKKIIEYVHEKCSDVIIEASENAKDGSVNHDVSISDPKNNDMILCRITAPLIELYMKYMRMNKNAYIKGSEDLLEEYINMLNDSDSTSIDPNCITHDGLFPNLYNKLINKIDKIKETRGLEEEDVLTLPEVLNYYDAIQGLRVISEGMTSVEDLKQKVKDVFCIKDNGGIQLSTVHKSKGLESDNVYIYMPSLLPYEYAKKEWEIISEKNLEYVAYTRAKNTLNFIKEDSKNRFSKSMFSSKSVAKDITLMREKLNLNKLFNVSEKNNIINENNVLTGITLGTKIPSTSTLNNKKIGANRMRKFLK